MPVRSRLLRALPLLALLAAVPAPAGAATAPLDSTAAVALLAAHAAPLALVGGALTGPGADSLAAELLRDRFVLVGEPHGFVEPPRFVAALYDAFVRSGPVHLAVETGPVSAGVIEGLAALPDPMAAFRRFDRDYPWGLPFYTWEEEAAMAAHVVRAGGAAGARASGPVLWGLDQEFVESSALHLARLAAHAPNAAARSLAERDLAEAREGSRKLVADKDPHASWLVAAPDAEFDALARAFAHDADAVRTLDELRTSRAIYRAWFGGDQLANNATRAALMKRHLEAALDAARAHGEAAPRAIFKFGYEHLLRGRSLMDTYEIGNTAHELAEASGRGAFAILVLPLGGTQNAFRPFGSSPADTAAAYDPHVDFDWLATGSFAAVAGGSGGAAGGTWTLVDLRPLRPRLSGATGLPRGLARLAWAYDAVLVVPQAHAAHLLAP